MSETEDRVQLSSLLKRPEALPVPNVPAPEAERAVSALFIGTLKIGWAVAVIAMVGLSAVGFGFGFAVGAGRAPSAAPVLAQASAPQPQGPPAVEIKKAEVQPLNQKAPAQSQAPVLAQASAPQPQGPPAVEIKKAEVQPLNQKAPAQSQAPVLAQASAPQPRIAPSTRAPVKAADPKAPAATPVPIHRADSPPAQAPVPRSLAQTAPAAVAQVSNQPPLPGMSAPADSASPAPVPADLLAARPSDAASGVAKIEGVSANKAGIDRLSASAVHLRGGKAVSIGGMFPSGEKLLAIDLENERIITNRRQILLFF